MQLSHATQLFLLVILLGIASLFPMSALAEGENPLAEGVKKTVQYPLKTAENLMHATGHAVENTGGVLQATGENIGETLSGEGDQVELGEPMEKTGAMTKQMVEETFGAPVKAAEQVNE